MTKSQRLGYCGGVALVIASALRAEFVLAGAPQVPTEAPYIVLS
ncbi:hypothetical protein [Candidatus Halocynthiibacter alkanivorans]|nr:hypothetical protein [Candidatus Halocynthiibacter alkanivorans]